MTVESVLDLLVEMEAEDKKRMRVRKVFLIISSILLVIGNSGAPLTMRLYFIHGGKRIWLTSWLQTAAFPIILIPLIISYLHRRRRHATTTETHKPKLILMEKLPLFLAAASIGTLTGLIDYLLAYGAARLPLSTGAMLAATELGFTAGFAYFLVKQKFTFYSINAVVLLTIGAAILALNSNGDRPAGESNKQYGMGFLVMLFASALFGLMLPLVELTYKKAKQAITWPLVMEIQFVMSFFATLFCTVGMLINHDFKVIPREAENYELGERKYYAVLVCSGILWQFSFLGTVGMIFSASSLSSGIIISVLLPVTEVLAVIFLKEKFQAQKGVALALSLWGFVSYFYGELKQGNSNNRNRNPETNSSQSVHP